MSHACTPILVGMDSPVSEILLLSKTAKFSFRTMDYSLWSSKKLIDRNQLKNFMQVGVDLKRMQTIFSVHGYSGFGDFTTFSSALKMAKTSLRTMDYSPWGSKSRIR